MSLQTELEAAAHAAGQEHADHIARSSDQLDRIQAVENRVTGLEARLAALESAPPAPTPEPPPDPTPPPAAGLLVDEGWAGFPVSSRNDATFRGWELDVPNPTTDFLKLVPNGIEVRCRSTQGAGTPLSPSSTGKIRSEIRRSGRNVPGSTHNFLREPLGVVRWYSTTLHVPANWQFSGFSSPKMKFVVTQFHGNESMPIIDITLWQQRGYVIVRLPDGENVANVLGLEWKDGAIRAWKRPMEEIVGTTLHLIVLAVWTTDASGRLESWLNGEKFLTYLGPTIPLDDDEGPYWSPVGIYSPNGDISAFDQRITCSRARIGDERHRLEDFA